MPGGKCGSELAAGADAELGEDFPQVVGDGGGADEQLRGDLVLRPDDIPGRCLSPGWDRIAEIKERYGPGHIVTQFITEASPDLLAAVERTERRLTGELAC